MVSSSGGRGPRSWRAAASRLAPIVVTTVVVWFAGTIPGGAAGSTIVADWQMDEPAGATVLVDHGPLGIDGAIGSSVVTGAIVDGAVAHRRSQVDPDGSPVDHGRLAVVDPDDRLNPGSGDFAVSLRLRTSSPQGNVVQKGQALAEGGYVKVDMDEGRIACLYLGSAGSAHVRSPASIADGAWHEVRCVRTDDEVVMVLDGLVVSRRAAVTGTVANDWPVTIAGKGSCNQVTVGCDYFSGDLDRVVLDRSPSLAFPAPPATVPSTSAPTTLPSTVPSTIATTVPPTTEVTTTTTTVRPTTTTTVRPPATTTTVRPAPTTTVPEVVK